MLQEGARLFKGSYTTPLALVSVHEGPGTLLSEEPSPALSWRTEVPRGVGTSEVLPSGKAVLRLRTES